MFVKNMHSANSPEFWVSGIFFMVLGHHRYGPIVFALSVGNIFIHI
jgi:hypothetical protein